MTNYNVYAAEWTEGAIYCYKRGCNCQGCYVKDVLETRCRMKSAVFELVRKFGSPKEKNRFTSRQQKVINAILEGCNDKYEISNKTGMKVYNVQTALTDMYELAEADGVIYRNLRCKLPDFIKWVRKGKEE